MKQKYVIFAREYIWFRVDYDDLAIDQSLKILHNQQLHSCEVLHDPILPITAHSL